MAYNASDKKKIEYLARKDEGAMKHDEFCAVVRDALADSVKYIDEELSPERAKATDYYGGKPLGNEEEGRSQVVMTEVRDAVDGMLPSLLRVFSGSEHAVEFAPTRADNVEQAAQKTDYVRYVFEEDNDGFLEMLSVLKDGLIRKIGVFGWGWDDSISRKTYKMEAIDKAQLDALAADPEVEFTKGSIKRRVDGMFDVELIRTAKDGRAWVEAVPPEEFIFNRQARKLGRALIAGRRMRKTRGELIAMGISAKEIDAHAGPNDADVAYNEEEIARQDNGRVGQFGGQGYSADPEMGKANDKILYCDVLMTVDFDGDGMAELRRVCTIGSGYYPVKNDPASDRGFAVFTPYPEPHTLIGGSVADRTMDIQKIDSAIMRGILDSGAAAIFPRTVYQEGMANVADIMNTAIGAPIRTRMDVNAAIRTLDVNFTGEKMIPLLGFMQEVIERRTGRNKGAAGLDADALQSTGKEAVGAVLTGSQEQIEMIARVFAQMTLKPLFRGLGKLLHERQPRSRVVRLRGNWVKIDPRQWDENMDVIVNVGLGATFTDKKVATLMAVAADQKEIIGTMGLANPLVSLPMLRNTRAKILALQGLKDVDNYYLPLPPNWQPPPPPPPQPSPDEMWIRAEKEMNHLKTMKELAIKEDELRLRREELAFKQAFEVRKLETESALERLDMEMKYQTEIDAAKMDREIDVEVKEAELTIQAHKAKHEMDLQEDKQAHEKQMAERAADTADKQASKKESAE